MKQLPQIPIGAWVSIVGYDAGGKDVDGTIGQFKGWTQAGNADVKISQKQTRYPQDFFHVKPSQITLVSDRDDAPPRAI